MWRKVFAKEEDGSDQEETEEGEEEEVGVE